MIKSIHFKEARSFAAAGIDLSAGLNVVVGDSDAGKSNIVRNLVSLLENSSASEFVRYGAANSMLASVAVTRKTDKDDNTLSLVRSKGGENYCEIYDGSGKQRFDKIGNSIPTIFLNGLGFAPIELGGESVWLSIQRQRGVGFLVDDTPARIARVLGAVSGLDSVYRAVRKGDEESRAADRVVSDREAEWNAARKVASDALAGVDIAAARDSRERAATALSNATDARQRSEGLQRGIETARQASTRHRAAAAIQAAIEGPVTKAESAYRQAERSSQSARELRSAIMRIKGISDALKEQTAEYDRLVKASQEAEAGWRDCVSRCGVCHYCGRGP